MGGFFAPQQAFAAANITPASDGTNISIDTTSAAGGSGAYTELSGPSITEIVAGDIVVGTHTITLPSGWEFNTGITVKVMKITGNIQPANQDAVLTANTLTFTITQASTNSSTLAFIFNSMQVRPTGTTPSTGNMTYSGTGIIGVVDGNTNFGTLSTVPGTVTKLAFTTQPGGAIYGSLLSPQPVVKTQDQFGNNSTSGLVATEMVSLTLTSGTGALVGNATLNIGTGGGTPGTVTFTDLKVGDVGAVGTKGLTASTSGLTSAVSGNFVISQKPLTATVTVNNKPYDGNNSAVITNVALNGVESGDVVTVNNNGTATFADPNADTGIVVTSTGVAITGTHVGNYSFGNTATGAADITPLAITITPTAGQNKIYNQADPTLLYTPTPALISPDTFTGALSRVVGEDVNTYAYTLGTLPTIGSNYTLTLIPETFEITQKALTVTATGVNKEYDRTTNATVTLSSDKISGDDVTLAYTTASFVTKNAENGKTINVSGISIGGTKAGNYALQNTVAVTTANIAKKPITVTINVNNKTYDGDTGATYSSTDLRVTNGVITGDTVVVENTGTKAFADKNIGVGKTVTATGLTLSGADAGNYDFGGVGTGTATINARPITITAITDNKVYDSTTDSDGVPVVTSTFSPPVAAVDTASFIQTYDNKNVGTVKTLTPSGTVSDGNSGLNYSYTFVTNTTGVITVKSINVTAQTDTKTYDGTTDSSVVPVVNALETGDTVGTVPIQTFDTENVATSKVLTPSGLVINDGNGGANYTIVPVTNNTGVINAKNLTVTGATTNSKTYDGGLTATVNFASPGLVGIVLDKEVLVSLISTNYSATFDNKNVGTNKQVTVSGLTLAGTGASNYSLTQPTLNDGVITKRALTVTAAANTKTYDGTLTATATPTITAGTLASGDAGTFTETYDNANVGATHILTPVGTIADTGGIDMTGNYDITFTPIATGVIEKAALTITAENKSKVYGDANPALTATYVGFVNSETASVLDTPVSLSTTAVDASSVGTYPITASGAADVNYGISFSSGTLTVTPAPLTVTAGVQTKVYGDADPALTYTHSALVAGDTDLVFSGTLSRVAGENAGTRAITQGTLTAGGNYTLTYVGANLTITARPITVTAVTNSKVYDGNNTASAIPTITLGTLAFSDTPGFSETYDNKNVGTNKTLTPSGTVSDGNSGANYNYTFVTDATGVITALGITVTPTVSQTKVYGQSDPTFTYTNTPALISPDTFSGALNRSAGENVGTYAYALGNLSAGGNYTLTLTPGTFAITKATPVITWANPADIVYGTALSGTQLNATADVAGAFVYTPVSGTVLNAGGQTLSIAFTPTDTTNYNNAEKTALIIVTKASLTVTAENKSKEYGTANPTLTASYSGFVNSETASVLDTPVSLSTTANNTSPTGDYNIVASGAVDINYNISFVSGTLTVSDTVYPTIISHTPSFNALNISPTTAIVVTFSEPVVVEASDVSFNPTISGGFTITGSGTSVVTIKPNNPLADNKTYTITLNGVTDINGISLPTYNNIKFTTATYYSLNLNADAGGWNLISLPVVPSSTAIAAVLGSVAGNINTVWTYNPLDTNAVGGWLVYNTGSPSTSNLDTMTPGFGYWINATSDATISGSGSLFIPGPTSMPSRELVAGWNLVGYYQIPGESVSIPKSAFKSLKGFYTSLLGFNNLTGGFIQPVEEILPGDAFWIGLTSAKTYIPSNLWR